MKPPKPPRGTLTALLVSAIMCGVHTVRPVHEVDAMYLVYVFGLIFNAWAFVVLLTRRHGQ